MNGRPDALFVSSSLKSGKRMVDRVASICDFAEPILGVDRRKGERAYIRLQPRGNVSWLFITASIEDTILFPKDDPRSGQPRYRWNKKPDGSEWGYLIDG